MAKGAAGQKRIVIIDDHPLIRTGLERLINADERFVVCGQAGSGAEGKELIEKEKPDLAIVDISLPDADGINLMRELLEKFPGLQVLILSMHTEPEFPVRALKTGATGYMVKNDAIENIGKALEEVSRGRRYLSPSIDPTLGL